MVSSQLTKCYHALWKSLHFLSFACSTKKERDGLEQILQGLSHSIPCSTCQKHLRDYLLANPLPSDPGKAAQYVVDLHNDVSRRNGKALWTLEKARGRYSISSACSKSGRPSIMHARIPPWVGIVITLLLSGLIVLLCVRTCDTRGGACEI